MASAFLFLFSFFYSILFFFRASLVWHLKLKSLLIKNISQSDVFLWPNLNHTLHLNWIIGLFPECPRCYLCTRVPSVHLNSLFSLQISIMTLNQSLGYMFFHTDLPEDPTWKKFSCIFKHFCAIQNSGFLLSCFFIVMWRLILPTQLYHEFLNESISNWFFNVAYYKIQDYS